MGGGPAAHAGHGPASVRCLNCGHMLGPRDRFCSDCGQDTANHAPTLMEFVHEFLNHYVAAEGKLWQSLWGLLARPGFLTAEYLAGRRTRYVPPLRLLLTFGLLFFLALRLLGDDGPTVTHEAPSPAASHAVSHVASQPASHPVASGGRQAASPSGSSAAPVSSASSAASAGATSADPDEDTAAGADRTEPPVRLDVNDVDLEVSGMLPAGIRERLQRARARWKADPDAALREMGHTALGYAPYAVLCSLPFFAALLKLLFWRQPYGAHFVFAMHLHAAWYAMLLIAVLLPWTAVNLAAWGWSNLYPLIALKRVHAGRWGTTLLRAALLAVLHWILILIGLFGLTTLALLSSA